MFTCLPYLAVKQHRLFKNIVFLNLIQRLQTSVHSNQKSGSLCPLHLDVCRWKGVSLKLLILERTWHCMVEQNNSGKSREVNSRQLLLEITNVTQTTKLLLCVNSRLHCHPGHIVEGCRLFQLYYFYKSLLYSMCPLKDTFFK